MSQKNVTEVAKASLAELAKRVPPNQTLQFQAFQAKHADYQSRVIKQPENLPKIDWEYYSLNVRPECKKWVEEFQQKYKELCQTFDERSKEDYSKYYVELEQVRIEMEAEVENFKAESESRIKALQEEYERIQALKPYTDMTAEEYSDLLPEKSMFKYEGRPSFWPHTPEEQTLKPALKSRGRKGKGGGDKGKPKKGNGGDGGGGATPPSTAAPPATVAAGDATAAPASENKDKNAASSVDTNTKKTIAKSQNLTSTKSHSQDLEKADMKKLSLVM